MARRRRRGGRAHRNRRPEDALAVAEEREPSLGDVDDDAGVHPPHPDGAGTHVPGDAVRLHGELDAVPAGATVACPHGAEDAKDRRDTVLVQAVEVRKGTARRLAVGARLPTDDGGDRYLRAAYGSHTASALRRDARRPLGTRRPLNTGRLLCARPA